uniref:Elongation of very long chain fatty acids protein n=1 Tax=Elaeophora elaphi TaxID=1147741 RepID=A0A0R3S134_9BILA
MARWEYWPYYGLENYLYTMPFEAKFNMMESTKWMQENWFHSITSSIAYVISIYIGQKLMESRKPFCLDNLLIAWNFGLALFSLVGVCRMTPELLWSVRENSFEYSICTASFAQGVTGFWTEMFALSKVAEFGDTVFIVLRKRPLLFLHWYHHVTVLVYTWHAYKDHTASGRWFIWMNYTVHAFMYTYYALRAMRKRLPKMAAMMVTILQILQMVGGVFIGINILRIKLSGRDCQQTWSNLYFSFTIYFSYFLLFCNFFYYTYLKKGNRYHAVLAGGIHNKIQKDVIMGEPLEDKNKENDVAVNVRNHLKRRIVK